MLYSKILNWSLLFIVIIIIIIIIISYYYYFHLLKPTPEMTAFVMETPSQLKMT